MKKHKGMRPHDIPVLVKIIALGKRNWLMKDLAIDLHISPGEVSESLNRSVIAGLISSDKRNVNRLAFLDFVKYGLKYVFPAQPGAVVRGIATAHSAVPLVSEIQVEDVCVMPYAQGNLRGQAVEPLYPGLPQSCLKDSKFYELMSLIDAFRVGRSREVEIATKILENRIVHGS